MKTINVMCPECGGYQNEQVREKTTSVCRNCHWPVDVWEDGTIKDSPLAECEPWVSADRYQTLGMGLGRDVRTRRTVKRSHP